MNSVVIWQYFDYIYFVFLIEMYYLKNYVFLKYNLILWRDLIMK